MLNDKNLGNELDNFVKKDYRLLTTNIANNIIIIHNYYLNIYKNII